MHKQEWHKRHTGFCIIIGCHTCIFRSSKHQIAGYIVSSYNNSKSHSHMSSTSNLHSKISKIMPVNTTNEWDSNSTKIVEVVSKGNKWSSDLYDLQLIKSTSSLYRYMATWWARFQSVVHTDMSVKHPQRVAKAITSVLQHATWRPHPNVQFSTDSANEVWGCWSYWEGCVLVL